MDFFLKNHENDPHHIIIEAFHRKHYRGYTFFGAFFHPPKDFAYFLLSLPEWKSWFEYKNSVYYFNRAVKQLNLWRSANCMTGALKLSNYSTLVEQLPDDIKKNFGLGVYYGQRALDTMHQEGH